MSTTAQLVTPRLTQLLHELAHAEDPISFYDAMQVLQQVRPLTVVPDDMLQQLLELQAASQCTDGARAIFTHFLRGYAKMLQAQIALAGRPITLKDSGKCARANRGDRLLISLEERRGSGYLWQLQQLTGQASCERRIDRAEGPVHAQFDVALEARGNVRLHFVESPPPLPASQRSRKPPAREPAAPRTFDLSIIVVERQSPTHHPA